MRRELAVCLLLLAVTLAVYWQIGDHQFIRYDDTIYVTDNPHVKRGLAWSSVVWAFTATEEANWHPLTWLSHMADCQLFGLRPRGHHLTSLFLHLANVLLLFVVLNRLTGALWRSAFVSALFALHPLHVESVAWVAERKDVLSTLFWLLTMLAYARYVEKPTRARYALTLVAFALGLMAKPMLVTLPFVLLLLDYWPLDRVAAGRRSDEPSKRRRKKIRPSEQRLPLSRLVREKTPFFVLVAISSVVTFSFQQRAGAVVDTEIFPLSSRMANALVSYLRYIGKMIWPSGLAVLYPHPGTSLPLWWGAGAGLALLGLSILVVLVLRRRPYLAVGWLWYVGTLVPVIGLIQVGVQAYADRYTYVPLIGLFIMIAWGVPELLGGWAHARTVLAVSAATALAALTACTWIQLGYWKDSLSLFSHTLQVTTKNYVAHNNLGNALADRGKVEEAISHYAEALRIKPDHAEAYNNWGTVLEEQGRFEEAVDRFRMALKVKPDYAAAHSNLGLALERQGRHEEAIAQYLEALRLDPTYAQAHNNLALALAARGQQDEAMAHYAEALRLRPDYAEAHNNLGHLLVGLGRLDEAAIHFAEAVRYNPDYAKARNNLGIVLVRLGRLDEAAAQFREALRIKPDYGEARNNLAVVLRGKEESPGNSGSRGVPY
ncbi:MAG TPA: tetratricopeptide repeat protein [Syntrophobacteria bacterium]|nr:tetratricopeptide repeat protein [Syntrophobacteria bacterium]